MSSAPTANVLRHIRRLTRKPSATAASDGELLERFIGSRDGDAFAELVRRHGPMVLGVCRSILRHEQDAEDAFQAAFLVLARKADSIRNRQSPAGFLYEVAYRVAVDTHEARSRRRAREQSAPEAVVAAPELDMTLRDLQRVVHEELRRLPEKYRLPLVLCYLEGYSQQEAAGQLGWSKGALRGRLDRGRERLRRRLERRGVGLSATLGATELFLRAPTAPAALMDAAARGVVSTRACAIAAGLTGMLSTKVKLAAGLLLVAGLCAGAVALIRPAEAAPEAEPPAAALGSPAPKAVPGNKDAVTFRGRVLDPDGKPYAGAKVYLFYRTPRKVPMPVQAIPDADGRFSFTVRKADFDRSDTPDPWTWAWPIAVAEGFGLGLPPFDPAALAADREVTVRMAPEAAISGRVLDLQGVPIAGVTVRVRGLRVPQSGDLGTFVEALQSQKEGFNPQNLLMGLHHPYFGIDFDSVYPPAVTDAAGRFRIRGIGRERVADLLIEGPTIESRYVYALTRPAPRIEVPAFKKQEWHVLMTHYGSSFDHVAAPSKPIVGVVRDKDTGKPIAGAEIRHYMLPGHVIEERLVLRTVSDESGRYRLTGMPRGKDGSVLVTPPAGKPYLMMIRPIEDTPGLEPVVVDVALKRGVWLDVRVIDKVTGKPVPSSIEYNVFTDNPHLKEAPGFTTPSHQQTTAKDGRFRLVGLPGRGVITALATDNRYRLGTGAEKIKGLESNGPVPVTPRFVSTRSVHALAEINPAEGAESVSVEIGLDPGRTLTGKILGPDGKPLAGVRVSGLTDLPIWGHEALKTAEFTVTGLAPGDIRLVQFAHLDKRLAGFLVLRGDEKGPLTVTLGPAGTLTGRLVTRDGKPAAGGQIEAFNDLLTLPGGNIPVPKDAGSLVRPPRTDKNGKFRIEGLIPGLKYRLYYASGTYLLRITGSFADDVTIKAGETKDLGDVVVQPIE
jgi:RNA polymerase sigma factor (sigma-70 family)